MYEAMGERAPESTKLAGAMTTALALAGVGYLAVNGLGVRFEPVVMSPTVLVTPSEVEDRVADEPLDLAATDPLKLTVEPPPAPEFDNFVPDGDTPITVVDGGKRRVEVVPGPAVDPPRAAVRVWPKLLPGDLPHYPGRAIRDKSEGVTALNVCVDARGRVSSASVAASSGHATLDEAALKWIRRARFTPGNVDGAAQAICGHSVVYEWRLADALKR
jgi:TonB family protein